ncbi:hypothetical protein MRS44_007376 [Fusarium solani]|uniref:uncharacterized protein n=1 Tax=Fusarium solani TaxID=169388 RepID=UPI0032C4934F|nr:hypothetical protein MRS44_007376 [Fusarium solani]
MGRNVPSDIMCPGMLRTRIIPMPLPFLNRSSVESGGLSITATLWLGLDSRVNPPTPMMTCQRVQPAPVPLITVGNNPYTPGTLMICTRSVHPTPFDPGTHASPAIHQNSSQGKPRLTLLHITTPHNYMSPEPTRHKPKSATFCTNAAMFA